MNQRFNLYSYGASFYQGHSVHQNPTMYPPAGPQPPRPWAAGHAPRVNIPQTPIVGTGGGSATPTPAPTVIREVDPLTSVLSAQALLNLFDLAVRETEESINPAPTPLVRRILNPRRPHQPLGRWDGIGFSPVIVRPTPDMINRATEELLGTQVPENTICTICQDTITSLTTTLVRKLRHCGHYYHRGCIDEWFNRSVLCPTCRHDIRE